MKFSPAEGEISIDLERLESTALVEVQDNGVGIPREQQESIFEEFKQITDSESEVRNGTGLGLAITKKRSNSTEVKFVSKVKSGVEAGSALRFRSRTPPRGPLLSRGWGETADQRDRSRR